MHIVFQCLRTHPFELHMIAFLLMLAPVIPMYLAAQQGATGWIAGLLSLVILGNLLEWIIR